MRRFAKQKQGEKQEGEFEGKKGIEIFLSVKCFQQAEQMIEASKPTNSTSRINHQQSQSFLRVSRGWSECDVV